MPGTFWRHSGTLAQPNEPLVNEIEPFADRLISTPLPPNNAAASLTAARQSMNSVATAALVAVLVLELAGHWLPAGCRSGPWWAEAWLFSVPPLLLGVTVLLILSRPLDRLGAALLLLWGVAALVYLAEFGRLAGTCAN
jgi:hypothetical protein